MRAIAERLAAVAPEGVGVAATTDTVVLSDGPSRTWQELAWMLDEYGDNEVTYRDIVCNVLDHAQENFTEWQTMPWPTNAPTYLDRIFAEPQVEIENGQIEMWFGPRDQPALVLAAIPLASVVR